MIHRATFVFATLVIATYCSAQVTTAPRSPSVSDSPRALQVRFRLEVLERASITAQRDGYLLDLPIKMGANIDSNQLVARFDETPTAARVRVAENELRELRVESKAAKRELE